MTEGHWTFGTLYYKKELILAHFLATYKKPLVALIDGTVMGAGAGLSMYAPFRIVTENTVFAMPEAAIGLFPDVGASHFLSRLPGFLGEYLGLAGARLDGAGMIACGLATHLVLSKDLYRLENALEGLTCSNATSISHLINKFVYQTNYVKQDSAYYDRLKIANKCFSRKTVEEILLALEKEVEYGEQQWIIDAINSMKSACPASLKIFLRTIREGRTQSLEQCLVREYNIVSHICRGTVSHDFYEGIRAVVIDKDKKPKWELSKLELITEEIVDQYFRNVDDDEDNWDPLKLPPRSSNGLTIEAARSKL
ncbi:3-hydroxyisobutyryl-CoA hydrolase 1 [Melia azedarach]|uniref:3-hydroxyisobutyryl-CoA hydrolase 1 n=1 Tax=Melia azedarach TaxID=155640 RepID=A0ACC1XV74_MELAZ|nr:3-hydroxyisobutyryl-CoA hydrolase 1 [Melia azedarach]